jgi:hypothetical protein
MQLSGWSNSLGLLLSGGGERIGALLSVGGVRRETEGAVGSYRQHQHSVKAGHRKPSEGGVAALFSSCRLAAARGSPPLDGWWIKGVRRSCQVTDPSPWVSPLIHQSTPTSTTFGYWLAGGTTCRYGAMSSCCCPPITCDLHLWSLIYFSYFFISQHLCWIW